MQPEMLEELEQRFGSAFVDALQKSLLAVDGSTEAESKLTTWQVKQAKDNLSDVLERVRSGKCQFVQRHKEEPVMMISMAQLAAFVELASPRRSFAEMIAPRADEPVLERIVASEVDVGQDQVEL